MACTALGCEAGEMSSHRTVRRPAVACVALTVAATVLVAGEAFAHDPIILTSDQSTPEAGPYLPDGTISFALYGVLEQPGDTRGLRAQLKEGDQLFLQLLVPDLEPERSMPADQLPSVTLVAPDGAERLLTATARTPYAEVFTQTDYLILAEIREPALAGEYAIVVSGPSAARFTLAIGETETFGTPVENVPNRDAGLPGVQQWYSTPPPLAPATTTASTVPAAPATTAADTTTPDTTPPDITTPDTSTAGADSASTTAPTTSAPVIAPAPAADAAQDDDGGSGLFWILLPIVVLSIGAGVFMARRSQVRPPR
jgi:hypothetical protein